MYLIQYLPYAITLIFILLPAVLLGFQQRSLNFYGLSGSFLILLIVFGSRPLQLFYLLGSFLWSILLIKTAILWREKQFFSTWGFPLFLLLSLFPMILKNFVLIQGKHLPLYAATACFSLKTIQVLAHIYKGRIQEYPAGECAGYLLFFPSLFLGPLNSSRQFHQTWVHIPSVPAYRRLLVRGLKELFWGILYLLFIAHILSLPLQSLESRIQESPVFCQILLYACFYGARLFFYLAGFSRIAAGCSCLLGTELKSNFQKPFLSVTIRQFWDRWQITFTDWLKEFIFCPLLKRFKKSRQFSCPLLQKCLGYFLTMGVLGVFYGITPSSLLFALYHGVVLCLWEVWETKSHLHEKWKHQPVYTFFTWIFTMLLLLFGFFILSGMFLKILFL